ncbi:hypothetical protein C1H21_03465 [Xanthomonas arboricola pv. juglandis]|nr:hypothetical protein C1H21_03465 [Xanthomonas arboricola pv. juglandis]
MPRKSLHRRTCGVSCDGGRARALQPNLTLATDRMRRNPDAASCPACNHAHRPSRLVLARPPSRDLTRHGCRVRAYMDVLAACPAMVGGQGPCCQAADSPLCN